ncbi:MAG: response regulator [Campylobacterota bacterium]|nr:response regulator [Campylobacterota bacterium]
MSSKNQVESNMKKVLITDDSITAIRLLTFHLNEYKNSKFDILEAKDGAEALFMLRDNDVDIVFLDLMMPIVDGYSVASFIYDRKLKVEIVVIASSLDKNAIVTLGKLGVKNFLPKPIDKERMKTILDKLILSS